jgi:hypothetical protein
LTWHQGDDGIYATDVCGRECGRVDMWGAESWWAFHHATLLGSFPSSLDARRAVESAHLKS